MNRLSVSWTRSGEAANERDSVGSAGRLISVAKAVIAVSAPRRAVKGSEPGLSIAPRSGRIFEAQHAAIVIIGEELGVAAPIDHRLEHFGRLLLGEVILELGEEASFGRAVAGPLVQHLADMGGKRNVAAELIGEDLLARL